jgi:hypothetical protein
VDLHVGERTRLEARLAADQHCSDAARQAVGDIDAKLSILHRQAVRLEERGGEFRSDAIMEHANQLRHDYVAAVDQVRRVLVEISAARVAAGRLGLEQTIVLPDFWPTQVHHSASFGDNVRVVHPGPSVSWVDGAEFSIKHDKEAERRWRAWADKILADPSTKATPIS